jgi:methionyl-tRNA formyltransferase
MKLVIFTRTGFHHTSFINRIQEECEVVCVIREAYPGIIIEDDMSQAEQNNAFLKDFQKRYSAGFSNHPRLKDYLTAPYDAAMKKQDITYLDIACGDINSTQCTEMLKDLRPDIVAVLGSSVIKEHIISIPSTAMINLHSGLSPYYRGTWSYGWPIVNGEPEYIGVTVHHVSYGIDSGDIICQTRPVLDNDDDLNDIFLKVIAEGIELMVISLKELIQTGVSASYKQPADVGRLYTMKDLTAEAALKCMEHLDSGIIRQYNAEKEVRDAKVKLYGYIPPNG